MKRKTLVDLLERNLRDDPRDAPAVYVEADVMADDMERYAPAAAEPMFESSPPSRPRTVAA